MPTDVTDVIRGPVLDRKEICLRGGCENDVREESQGNPDGRSGDLFNASQGYRIVEVEKRDKQVYPRFLFGGIRRRAKVRSSYDRDALRARAVARTRPGTLRCQGRSEGASPMKGEERDKMRLVKPEHIRRRFDLIETPRFRGRGAIRLGCLQVDNLDVLQGGGSRTGRARVGGTTVGKSAAQTFPLRGGRFARP